MLLTLFLILCVILSITIYVYPAVAKVPVNPGSVPFFGHIFKLVTEKDLFRFLILDTDKFANENGGVTVMKSPIAALYFITNLEDAQYILEHCLDKMFVYKIITDYAGDKFFAAEVSVWKPYRDILYRALKPSVFDGYIEMFNEQADSLTRKLGDNAGKGYMNLKGITCINSLQTAFLATLGTKESVDNDLVQLIHDLLTMMIVRFRKILFYSPFIFKYSELKKQLEEKNNLYNTTIKMMIDQNIHRYVDKKNSQISTEESLHNAGHVQNSRLPHQISDPNCPARASQAPKFRTTLDLILDVVMTNEGCAYSDNDLIDLVKTMIFSQSDTSYRQIINLLLCIGSYPEVQEKVYEEIIAVIGEEGFVTKEHLSQLVYVDAVVKECLRYLPNIPLVARQSAKEIKLSNNVTIPPGGTFAIHIWSINRSEKYWGPDAKEFKPERWLNPETYNPDAFLSFSLGKRNCLGKSFALMTMKISLVHICRKYRLTADLNKIKFHYFGMIQPYGREQLKIEIR